MLKKENIEKMYDALDQSALILYEKLRYSYLDGLLETASNILSNEIDYFSLEDLEQEKLENLLKSVSDIEFDKEEMQKYIDLGKSDNITGYSILGGEPLDQLYDNTLIELLKEKVGVKKSIKEYGISEEDFLNSLDEMSEQAFDDQCTGANPRYPLIAEIKDLYLKAYYGN